MSIDAKANTLPKWSYILLAALLVPFGVGLIWAIVSKGNVPDAVTVIAAVCFFTAIALIVHLAWPRRSMWFAHLAAFVLFFILFLFLHAYGETEAGAFAFVMAFMSLLTLALMANLAYKDEGWGKGMLDSEKAFRLGRPLLMFYRLFLAFGILAEIVPGMAALISDNSGILICMFMTTYPIALWNKFTDIDGNPAEKQADGTTETKNHENHVETRKETSIYVRKDILRYRR